VVPLEADRGVGLGAGLAFVAGLFVILGVMAWSAGPPAVQSKKMEPEFITES
jgi:hypothetical protein